MSKQNSAVERKGISTPETVSHAHQGGNTPIEAALIGSGYRRFSDAVHHAADIGAVQCAGPFVRYAEQAVVAFRGIECILALVEASDVRKSAVEDGNDEPAVFSVPDRDSLLGLAQLSAKLLADEADNMSEWADRHFVRGEQ